MVGRIRSNPGSIKATGSVLSINYSTLELFQTLIDYGGMQPTKKPTSEESVTEKREESPVKIDEENHNSTQGNTEESTSYNVTHDTVRVIGGGNKGELYFPGDTTSKTTATKNPYDGQYNYKNIPWPGRK